MKYYNYSDLRKDFPDPCNLIDRENAEQYPNAVFMEAVVGEKIDEEGNQDLMILFSCDGTQQILWVWVSGNLLEDNDSYIDEYYFVTYNEGAQYLDSLEKGKWGE